MDNYIYVIKVWSFTTKEDNKKLYKLAFLTYDKLDYREMYINSNVYNKLVELEKPFTVAGVKYSLTKELKAYITDVVI